MIKIGKQRFIDSFDYSDYCCNYLNNFARDCWDNKNWAKVKLEPSEYFEDDNGYCHTEIVSNKLNTIIDNASERYREIGIKYFGSDFGLNIECTIFTDE